MDKRTIVIALALTLVLVSITFDLANGNYEQATSDGVLFLAAGLTGNFVARIVYFIQGRRRRKQDKLALCTCASKQQEVYDLAPHRLDLLPGPPHHTIVHLGRCRRCNGLAGFPTHNLMLVIEGGTADAKRVLEETKAA